MLPPQRWRRRSTSGALGRRPADCPRSTATDRFLLQQPHWLVARESFARRSSLLYRAAAPMFSASCRTSWRRWCKQRLQQIGASRFERALLAASGPATTHRYFATPPAPVRRALSCSATTFCGHLFGPASGEVPWPTGRRHRFGARPSPCPDGQAPTAAPAAGVHSRFLESRPSLERDATRRPCFVYVFRRC